MGRWPERAAPSKWRLRQRPVDEFLELVHVERIDGRDVVEELVGADGPPVLEAVVVDVFPDAQPDVKEVERRQAI